MGSLKWIVACFLNNWSYNFGPTLSRVPILDMFPPLGYLCASLVTSKVVGLPYLETWVYAYLCLMVLRTQLWLQRMDIKADAAVGKRTTAVFLGSRVASFVVYILHACEFAVAYGPGCLAAQIFSVYSACVFSLELTTGIKEATMALMGVGGLAFIIGLMRCMM